MADAPPRRRLRGAADEAPLLTGNDALLWEIMEKGAPVRVDCAGELMKERGSTDVYDEASFESYWRRSRTSLRNTMDLERWPGETRGRGRSVEAGEPNGLAGISSMPPRPRNRSTNHTTRGRR